MFILGNFLYAAAYVTDIALGFYMWAIIISALLSWVNPDPYNPIVRFLYRITEPVLSPIPYPQAYGWYGWFRPFTYDHNTCYHVHQAFSDSVAF